MSNNREQLMLQALLAGFREANLYLRDTSRRIEEHIRFYLTGATALVGAITFPFATGMTITFTKVVFCLGTFGLYGLGIITLLRLISIKTQATQHTAWQKSTEYRITRLAFGKNIGIKRPKTPQGPAGPFSKRVVFFLRLLSVHNSVVLAVCVGTLVSIVLEATSYATSYPTGLQFVIYGLPTTLGFVLSALLLCDRVEKGWRQAFVEYEQVLRETTPPIIE